MPSLLLLLILPRYDGAPARDEAAAAVRAVPNAARIYCRNCKVKRSGVAMGAMGGRWRMSGKNNSNIAENFALLARHRTSQH